MKGNFLTEEIYNLIGETLQNSNYWAIHDVTVRCKLVVRTPDVVF